MNWREPNQKEFEAIGRVLVKNKIRDCGEYQIKYADKGTYPVAGTRDGKNWSYYLVNPEEETLKADNANYHKPPY